MSITGLQSVQKSDHGVEQAPKFAVLPFLKECGVAYAAHLAIVANCYRFAKHSLLKSENLSVTDFCQILQIR
jgi:hypothetical protein